MGNYGHFLLIIYLVANLLLVEHYKLFTNTKLSGKTRVNLHLITPIYLICICHNNLQASIYILHLETSNYTTLNIFDTTTSTII